MGNMGRGMCKNLAEKGNLSEPLLIFNRTTKRAEDLHAKLGQGKTVVSKTIDDAVVKSDIIFSCLGDDAAIVDALSTAAECDINGKLFVDCSTVHPDTTEKLAKLLTEKGAEFVACPVFGAPAMADNGQLICVLAGPAAAVSKVRPYCKGVMGRAEIDFSDQAPGKATTLKLIGNTFILGMVEVLSEGHTVAEKSGLGSENLHKFIEIMFPGPYTAYSTRMMEGDYYQREEPLFGVDLARKDARHAMDLASAAGAQMKAVKVADGHLAEVQEHMGSKGDIAGIYGAVRKEAGLPFEIGKK